LVAKASANIDVKALVNIKPACIIGVGRAIGDAITDIGATVSVTGNLVAGVKG